MFAVLCCSPPKDFIELSRPTKVKLGEFSQRHPLCNVPSASCSHILRTSAPRRYFRHPRSDVGRKLGVTHDFTAAAENVCQNEWQHRGLCCPESRKLLEASGTSLLSQQDFPAINNRNKPSLLQEKARFLCTVTSISLFSRS